MRDTRYDLKLVGGPHYCLPSTIFEKAVSTEFVGTDHSPVDVVVGSIIATR
jgi:hypothetical protein